MATGGLTPRGRSPPWQCFCSLVGVGFAGDLQGRHRGHSSGLLRRDLRPRSAKSASPAADLASWLAALAVVAQKCPEVAVCILDLHFRPQRAASLGELGDSRDFVILVGAEHILSWFAATQGARIGSPKVIK